MKAPARGSQSSQKKKALTKGSRSGGKKRDLAKGSRSGGKKRDLAKGSPGAKASVEKKKALAKGSRSGGKKRDLAKGSPGAKGSGEKKKALAKGSRSGGKKRDLAKGSPGAKGSGDKKKAPSKKRSPWKLTDTPVRPIRKLPFEGPYDPLIADKIEKDDEELAARVLRSPDVYGVTDATAKELQKDDWKYLISQERMVQLRELKDETAFLEAELELAVKFMDLKQMMYKKVLRVFSSRGIHKGTVVAWKKPYFKVKYEDDDEEELSPMEVLKHLIRK